MLRQAHSVNSSLPFDGRSNLDQREDLTSERKAVWELYDFAREVVVSILGVQSEGKCGWLGTSSALVYFT